MAPSTRSSKNDSTHHASHDNQASVQSSSANPKLPASIIAPSVAAHSRPLWKPEPESPTHSWNEQDRKHQLQRHLTGLEEGKETGFTEGNGQQKATTA
ncbi:hypothetical protein FQN57_001400 [Myotisia sp. PD_48]|nr:hypothetical protein FQN57_001400 [Myotisia sp. PD_48]